MEPASFLLSDVVKSKLREGSRESLKKILFRTALCAVAFVALGTAAPRLRLAATTVGPVSIAVGQNGGVQVVEASNAGDSALSLAATSDVIWIAPNIGLPRTCSTQFGTCTPVNMRLDTASLAKGIYTGTVTVTDPNAVDAPQTIVVVAQVGGGVPDRVELYVPPDGRTITQGFQTNARVNGTASLQSTGPRLSLAMAPAGSYDFSFTYTIQANAPAGTPEQDYTGSISVNGSSFAPDNKVSPVTLRVTSRPIAATSPSGISFRIAQGTTKVDKWLFVSNTGFGSLNLTGVTATAASGGTWLTGKIVNGIVVATADSRGLVPGVYTGSLAVQSNAANPVSASVSLEIVAVRGPTVLTGGVIDNALGEPNLALGGIVAIFGEQFTSGDPVAETVLPLKTTLGGARVFLNDVAIPVYTVAGSSVVNATGQINAVIPYDARVGDGVLRVERDGVRGNSVAVKVVRSAPRILRLGIANYGIVINSDASYPIPVTPGIFSHPAKAGDALVVYALGFGPTDPPVQTGVGAPAQEPLARVPGNFKVYFGGSGLANPAAIDPFYIGLTPFFVGLYQINVVVPASAPKGPEISLYVSNDSIISNRVNIAIE